MKDDIGDKLLDLTQKVCLDESDVVYLLVQLSKHYDRQEIDGADERYRNKGIECVKFFRNWAVHGWLEYRQTYLERTLEKYSDIGEIPYKKIFSDLMKEINDIGIINITADLGLSFKDNLYKVITDIPISIKDKNLKITAHRAGKITIEKLYAE